MEYIIEFIAEFIGNITGKCEPEKMPNDLEYKEAFTVKPYPKNIILWYLGVIACFAAVPFAYLGDGTAFAAVFAVIGIILLIIGAALNASKYEFDEEKIVHKHLFLKTKVIYWKNVRFVKLFEKTGDRSVTLALYSENKLLIDFISPMKCFFSIQKMAEHLGYEITFEKDPSLKRMLNP